METEPDGVATMRSFIQRKRREEDAQRGKNLDQARKDFRLIVGMIIKDFDPDKIYQWGSLVDGTTFQDKIPARIAQTLQLLPLLKPTWTALLQPCMPRLTKIRETAQHSLDGVQGSLLNSSPGHDGSGIERKARQIF
jgi:hypothetical protein